MFNLTKQQWREIEKFIHAYIVWWVIMAVIVFGVQAMYVLGGT